MSPTEPSASLLTEKFTRRDYLQLPEGFPAELIDGEFVKEPSPTYRHQGQVLRLALRLVPVVGDRRVVIAPADVSIDDWNVLQPDVLVRNPADDLVDPAAEPGVPVLVAEVLSPSTARRDRDLKTAIYLRAGVGEVWLVDPEGSSIEVHDAGGVATFRGAEPAVSRAVEGFRVSWTELA